MERIQPLGVGLSPKTELLVLSQPVTGSQVALSLSLSICGWRRLPPPRQDVVSVNRAASVGGSDPRRYLALNACSWPGLRVVVIRPDGKAP